MHIGFIPDGNRRWCKKHAVQYGTDSLPSTWLELLISHLESIPKGDLEMETPSYKIQEISFFVASEANCKRKDHTLENISSFFRKVDKLLDQERYLYIKDKFKVGIVGDTSCFPVDIQKILKKTGEFKGSFPMTLAVGYDPKKDLEGILKGEMERFQTDIDLVIRTGNEKRTSGFFPLQTLQSEWIFLEKLWPDFTFKDLKECLLEYSERERRFGS